MPPVNSDVDASAPPTDEQATPNRDPFVDDSSPRRDLTPGSLTALLASVQQIVSPPPPPPPMATPVNAHPHPPRRAQCTHIAMARLHGRYFCQLCGRVPDFGWLYVCCEDWLIEHQHSHVATAAESAIVVPDQSEYFEVSAQYAESLKMSSSVIKQMRDGLYDYDQVEKLIAQKENLISTIKKMEGLSVDATPGPLYKNVFQSNASMVASIGAAFSIASPSQKRLSAPPSASSSQQPSASKENIARPQAKAAERCNYMVCHACRPFLQERLYTTIESVLNGDQPPLGEEEAKTLHVVNANLLRNLDFRREPQGSQEAASRPGRLERSASMNFGIMQVTNPANEDANSLDQTPSTESDSMDYDDEYDEYDDDDDYDNAQEHPMFDPYPRPGSGICPVYSRHSGCAYDSADFDDGQRAVNHGFQPASTAHASSANAEMTPDRPRHRLRHMHGSIAGTPGGTSTSGSSISLPTPTTVPLTPDTPNANSFGNRTGKAATVSGVLSPSMDFSQARLSVGTGLSVDTDLSMGSDNTFGSEMEVDGGVALTEEAINTGLPDIRNQT